jgi:hypothetical protein
MLRKLLFFVVVIFLVIGGGIVIFEKNQKTTFKNDLSERSKKFIAEQSLAGDLKYAPLTKEAKEDFKGQRVSVGDCFSFVMPYSVSNWRLEGECSGYYSFDRPKGSIVTYLENAVGSGIDQASGVGMRRMDKEKYEEREIKVGDNTYTGFIDKSGPFTITIYRRISDKTLIFTLKLPEEDAQTLSNILGSLKFNI